MANMSDMRTAYHGADAIFDCHHLSSTNPIKQFGAWFEEIREMKLLEEPNAMAIATATKNGAPSVRMVLMKEYTEEGFKFFTNYESRKSQEIEENPNVCLMFYWEPMKRQVRIEGVAEKIPSELSEKYFNSRPKESRIGAMVSKQSTVIAGRQVLDERNTVLHERYKDEPDPPRPAYWGGFLVRPRSFEFWQGQTNRLHDRLRFRKLSEGETFDGEMMSRGENEWIIERLSP